MNDREIELQLLRRWTEMTATPFAATQHDVDGRYLDPPFSYDIELAIHESGGKAFAEWPGIRSLFIELNGNRHRARAV